MTSQFEVESPAPYSLLTIDDLSPEESAAADKHDDSVFHKLKMTFIILKITIVSLFLVCAVRSYNRRYKQCTLVSFMLSSYIAMLLILLAMDLTLQIIPVFFVLILLANYFNFIGFWVILRNLPAMEGRTLRGRTKAYFIFVNCLYAAVGLLALVPAMRPLCTDEKAYPYVMNFASCLFLLNWVFQVVISCNKQAALKRLSKQESTATNMTGATLIQNEDDDAAGDDEEAEVETKYSWEHKSHSAHLKRTMFRRQLRFYICFTSILACTNLTMQIWGRYGAHEAKVLGCAEKGYQWVYTSMYGEIFVTCHIVQIIMQAVMLEKALYKVPHEIGWFQAPQHAECSEDEDGVFDQDQKIESKTDDDYKMI